MKISSKLNLFLIIINLAVTSCGKGMNTADSSEPDSASQPTVNLTPVAVSTLTLIPEPTATFTPEPSPTPVPVPIELSNVSQISLDSIQTLEYKFFDSFYRWNYSGWNYARYSPDGAYIIVDIQRGIDVLDAEDLELVSEYQGLDPISFVDSDRLFVKTQTDLAILNYVTGELVELNQQGLFTDGYLTAYALHPAGDQLAISTGATTVEVISLTGDETRSIQLQGKYTFDRVDSLTFSPDGLYLLASGNNAWDQYQSVTLVMDTESGEYLYELLTNGPLVFSPKGTEFAFRGPLTLEVANLEDGKDIGSAPAFLWWDKGGMQYGYMDFTGMENMLAVAYTGMSGFGEDQYKPDALMVIYEYPGSREVETIRDIGQNAANLDYAPDGTRFMIVNPDDASIRLFDSESKEIVSTRIYYRGGEAAISPDGQIIAVPSATTLEIMLFDANSMEQLNSIDVAGYLEQYTTRWAVDLPANVSIKFINANQLLVNLSDWNVSLAMIWDIQEKQLVRTYVDASCNEFSGNTETMICYTDGKVQVFETFTGTSLYITKQDYGGTGLSYDGQQFISCLADTTSYTIKPLHGRGLGYLTKECQGFFALPSGSEILLLNGEIISIETGESRVTLEAPGDQARRWSPFGYYSPSGDYVLFGTSIYDLTSGVWLVTLEGIQAIYSAAISEDGLTLILVTNRGFEYWSIGQ